jgi:hypothetical protein
MKKPEALTLLHRLLNASPQPWLQLISSINHHKKKKKKRNTSRRQCQPRQGSLYCPGHQHARYTNRGLINCTK